jgi:hypothetical protein
MKFQKILLASVMFLLIVSCKNESKETEAKSEKLPETFNVAFNLTVKKDDTFTLYYTEDGTMNFGDALTVKSVIKGSDAPQEILFKLPVDVVPTNIRLDFGDNKDQENIVVNSMRLKYFDKVFEAKTNLVKNLFYTVESQTKYDEATSTVILVKTPGQAYDPLMWSNELLGLELKKLVQ